MRLSVRAIPHDFVSAMSQAHEVKRIQGIPGPLSRLA